MDKKQQLKIRSVCEVFEKGKSTTNKLMDVECAIDIAKDYLETYSKQKNEEDAMESFEETEDTETVIYLLNLIYRSYRKRINNQISEKRDRIKKLKKEIVSLEDDIEMLKYSLNGKIEEEKKKEEEDFDEN